MNINNPYSGYPQSYTAGSQINEIEISNALQQCSRAELQHFLDNEAKINDIVKGLPQVKSLTTAREVQIVKNKSLAESNLALQPRLADMKRIVGTNYEDCNKQKLSLGKNVSLLESKVGKQSTDALLAALQAKAAETDEESEKIADQFCQNSISVDHFVNEYIPKRTQAYLHRTKAEKMQELISQGPSKSGYPMYGTEPTVGKASFPPNSPPYPTGNQFSMPAPYAYPR
ncbi:hypothetical protein ACJMK2_012602 [Sinanodonta woodiana]|uniref:VPS37 C-terminal domain-containing protein n=1 Tax=Sinanodonta woodiana TaxID=1069815 RepID=A0ABD3VBR5_SINWO